MNLAEVHDDKADEIERRFRAYADAAQRAQQTLAIDDMLEAGRRWRAWLDLFLPPESPMPRSPLRIVK